MVNTLLSTILQLVAFSLIPFIVYLIHRRRVKGFMDYVGLKASTAKANYLAVAASLLFLLPALILTFTNDTFHQVMTDPDSISGHFRSLGFSAGTLVMIGLTAILKTALAEEILFRGFVAKRLMAWLGYQWGNIMQGVIFGMIHFALFLGLSDNLFFPVVIFLFSGFGAYISACLNEKFANGSIIPGWISHALANVVSYSVVAFVA